jgi:hypothetical protein
VSIFTERLNPKCINIWLNEISISESEKKNAKLEILTKMLLKIDVAWYVTLRPWASV